MPAPVTKPAAPTTAKDRVLGKLALRRTTPAPVHAPKPTPVVGSLRKVAALVEETLAGPPPEFLAKLKELESARLKKNAWAREHERLEAEVKEAFEKLSLSEHVCTVEARDESEEVQAVNVTITKQTGGVVEVEVLNRDTLKRLVTPQVYEKCLVIQKGLVKAHAGEVVLSKITSYTTEKIEGTVVSIKAKKVKGPKKPK